jgi:hypothetical protein
MLIKGKPIPNGRINLGESGLMFCPLRRKSHRISTVGQTRWIASLMTGPVWRRRICIDLGSMAADMVLAVARLNANAGNWAMLPIAIIVYSCLATAHL